MEVVYHIGVHCTGQDKLIRSLLKNRDALASEGIVVPGPGKYRRTINEAINILKGSPASEEAQDVILEAVLDTDDAERIILSNESFICAPGKVLDHGTLYGMIGKSAWLRQALPQARAEFALGLRNMATFLPALFDLMGDSAPLPGRFLDGIDPFELYWSEVIEGISEANPDAEITVWCDEDSPLLWPEIMRELAGVDPLFDLAGTEDRVNQVLSPSGREQLLAALQDTPPETEAMRRRIVEDILEEHADEAALEQDVRLPDWTGDFMDALTTAYEEDLDRIAAMPKVRLLEP